MVSSGLHQEQDVSMVVNKNQEGGEQVFVILKETNLNGAPNVFRVQVCFLIQSCKEYWDDTY